MERCMFKYWRLHVAKMPLLSKLLQRFTKAPTKI